MTNLNNNVITIPAKERAYPIKVAAYLYAREFVYIISLHILLSSVSKQNIYNQFIEISVRCRYN